MKINTIKGNKMQNEHEESKMIFRIKKNTRTHQNFWFFQKCRKMRFVIRKASSATLKPIYMASYMTIILLEPRKSEKFT